jgi:hypothetical protein
MAISVTKRVDEVKQPRGGYIPLRSFERHAFDDGNALHQKENLAPGVVGTVVDNLTRLMINPVYWIDGSSMPRTTPEQAFRIALQGARMRSAQDYARALSLASGIHGLDDDSIIRACKLSAYDAYRRAGERAYVNPDTLVPDEDTRENIKTMVYRCTKFFDEVGPVTSIGPTFEGAYTTTVPSGDADLVTNDTLWDLKVMKGKPKTKHTLQLYMYYLMGKRSNEVCFLSVDTMCWRRLCAGRRDAAGTTCGNAQAPGT